MLFLSVFCNIVGDERLAGAAHQWLCLAGKVHRDTHDQIAGMCCAAMTANREFFLRGSFAGGKGLIPPEAIGSIAKSA